jgi:hypothetical protein
MTELGYTKIRLNHVVSYLLALRGGDLFSLP